MTKLHVGHVIRSVLKIKLLVLLIAGCKHDAVTSANITIPIDTLDISTFDTVRTRSSDTVFVFDTTVIVDTVLVVTQSVYDSVVFPLEGYIGDATMEILDLGTFQIPKRARIWVELELSGNTQKDEAWGFLQSCINSVPLDCPLVPDYTWFGEGWVFVCFAEPGEFSLEARHASLYDCYSPVDSFRTANSVHFKQVKFVWADTRL